MAKFFFTPRYFFSPFGLIQYGMYVFVATLIIRRLLWG